MTQEERMRIGLRVLARNLYGEGLDSLKPMSVHQLRECADFALALAEGTRFEKFDSALEETQ